MLTLRLIRDAKPGKKTRILWDAKVRGLGLRVTPGGVKAFILNYRVAGRERRATLGRYPAISLCAARERAGSELAGIRAGETDPLERRRETREAPTVADGLDRFFGQYVPARQAIGRLAPKTVEEYGYQARGIIRPALSDLRRTVMTAAAASGIGSHVLRDLLGHRTTAMADRYIRAVGNPVRDAREQVGAAISAWMAGGD